MKYLSIIIFCFAGTVLFSSAVLAQDANWASWAHKIPVIGYEGHQFRLSAKVKADVTGEGAAARLWARVDKPGNNGFFYNMDQEPIETTEWKEYNIEGVIDSAGKQLVIGALVNLSGKFYYDDFKVEIETEKGKWQTVFSDDFENGMAAWEPGIGSGKSGISDQFKASVQPDAAAKSKVLLIEGN